MYLKTYLTSEGMTLIEFADKIGYHYRYLSRVINQHVKPGKKIVRDIMAAVGHAGVTHIFTQKKPKKLKRTVQTPEPKSE